MYSVYCNKIIIQAMPAQPQKQPFIINLSDSYFFSNNCAIGKYAPYTPLILHCAVCHHEWPPVECVFTSVKADPANAQATTN